MAVTASITVQFTSQDSDTQNQGTVYAEIDDRETGYNGGRTSFRLGEDVYFLVYNERSTIDSVVSSAGTITLEGSGTRSIGEDASKEYVTFLNSRESSLSRPIGSNLVTTWHGNDLGTVTAENATTLQVEADGVGVLQVSYDSPFTAYRLHNVDATIEQVAILITATQTG